MEVITNYINDANIVDLLISGVINLVIALLIFIVGKWIARMVQNTLEKLLRIRNVDEVLVALAEYMIQLQADHLFFPECKSLKKMHAPVVPL